MDLLGATLNITYNDSRAGWFGRGLSLEEPVNPLQNSAGWLDGDTGVSAQTSFRSSGLLPANEGKGSIVPFEDNQIGCPTELRLELELVQESQASGSKPDLQSYGGWHPPLIPSGPEQLQGAGFKSLE